MRLELTRVGLLVELANHYTTRGAQGQDSAGWAVFDPVAKRITWYTTLLLTGKAGRLEKPNSNNRLVMRYPSLYESIPDVFFKLLMWHANTQLFLSYRCLKAVVEGQLCWESTRLEVSRIQHATDSDGEVPVLEFGKSEVPLH